MDAMFPKSPVYLLLSVCVQFGLNISPTLAHPSEIIIIMANTNTNNNKAYGNLIKQFKNINLIYHINTASIDGPIF